MPLKGKGKWVKDKILVLKNGELIENNIASEILNNPKNDYTKKLIKSVI